MPDDDGRQGGGRDGSRGSGSGRPARGPGRASSGDGERRSFGDRPARAGGPPRGDAARRGAGPRPPGAGVTATARVVRATPGTGATTATASGAPAASPPRGPSCPSPSIPEGVTGKELDRSIHQQLRTLSKENAEGVAQHLVMVSAHLEADDIDAAMAHAETAVRRAGRVPAAREALGMVAYRSGDFARALTEFRTVRRLSGSSHLLPLMVDCERGLGRHGRALDLAVTPEARTLSESERLELAIVVSGIRRDLGQDDAALLALQVPALKRGPQAGVFRLHYAYADALAELGRADEAREWFLKAIEGDVEGETDAVERLEELDGISITDSADDELDDVYDLDELLGSHAVGGPRG